MTISSFITTVDSHLQISLLGTLFINESVRSRGSLHSSHFDQLGSPSIGIVGLGSEVAELLGGGRVSDDVGDGSLSGCDNRRKLYPLNLGLKPSASLSSITSLSQVTLGVNVPILALYKRLLLGLII